MAKTILHVGLDFGTKLTKVCIYNTRTGIREFFKFPNGKYFLPSVITKVNGNKFCYGILDIIDPIQEYSYFKMASADDIEFHIDTYEIIANEEARFYSSMDWQEFSPEFLSVLYICFVTQLIEEKFKIKKSPTSTIGGFLQRFLGDTKNEDEYAFTYRMGIPTEWSQKKNILRKRKFENIFLLSQLMRKEIQSSVDLIDADIDVLKADIQVLNNKITNLSSIEFGSMLNDYGLSLYPENAAGLTTIIKTKQLNPGYYSAMDIGAGTTDISFFKVLQDNTFKYIASESYIFASNNVYNDFSTKENLSDITNVEKHLHNIINQDPEYATEAGEEVKTILIQNSWKFQKLLKRLFAKRVRGFHEDKGITTQYDNQPIIMYGGGSRFNIIGYGDFELWDNGNSESINITIRRVQKKNILEYLNLIETKPKPEILAEDLVLLVVALGLSFIQHNSNANWFDSELYSPLDYDKKLVDYNIVENQIEVLIYDIFKREWVNANYNIS